MKAKKALKRLAKIEALISDVAARYSPSVPHIREALRDAQAVFARLSEAVSLQESSGTAKNPPLKQKKAAVTGRAPAAKTAKKSAPIKRAAKKTVAKKT